MKSLPGKDSQKWGTYYSDMRVGYHAESCTSGRFHECWVAGGGLDFPLRPTNQSWSCYMEGHLIIQGKNTQFDFNNFEGAHGT